MSAASARRCGPTQSAENVDEWPRSVKSIIATGPSRLGRRGPAAEARALQVQRNTRCTRDAQ
jgi:hypothetical protein